MNTDILQEKRQSVHVNTLNKKNKSVLQYVLLSASKRRLSLNVLTCSAIHIFLYFILSLYIVLLLNSNAFNCCGF